MMDRLELALLLALFLGSLSVAAWVARPAELVEPAAPLGLESATVTAMEAEPARSTEAGAASQRSWLPSFDGFDAAGFGLLPDVVPIWSPSRD